MARPTAQNLNRAVGVTSGRTAAAPGLAVQAPLDVNVGPNNLQALADILGVGANIAIDRAREESERRVLEETEMLATKAETDFHGGTFDEEQYRRSRTYRKTHDTLAGARQGVEGRLSMRKAAEDFVTANPYADEAAVREQLEFARMSVLMDENGQYKPEFQNERVRAVAEQALMEEGYEYISKWRDPYVKRMQEKGAAEAEGLFIAAGLSEGGTTVANMNATAQQLSVLGMTPDQINGRIVTSTIALARQLRKPELLDQLPLAWTDGSVGPMADAQMLATVNQQKEIITNLRDAEQREAQWTERFEFSSQVQEKINRGERLTPEEVARAQDLGYTPEAAAEWNDQADRTAASIAAQLAEEQEEAQKADLEFTEYQSNPYAVTGTKAEDILGAQWDAAQRRGDRTAMAEILRIGAQNGHLPATLRRYLNNAPRDFNQFQSWRRQLQGIDQMDDELYASLQEDARVMYEAYNGLVASARFSEQEAFQRVQVRDTKRGGEFVKGQARFIQQMAGNDGSLMASKVRERMYAFASLPDLDDATILQITRESIEKDYITDNGRLLPRRYFPNEQAVTHAKMFYSQQERINGRVIDPDDVVVALPEGTSDLLFYDRKDPTRVRRLPVDRLVSERRAGAQRARDRAAAPSRNAQAAARQRLDPWRDVAGESFGEKQARINREIDALSNETGVYIGTRREWQRRFGTNRN